MLKRLRAQSTIITQKRKNYHKNYTIHIFYYYSLCKCIYSFEFSWATDATGTAGTAYSYGVFWVLPWLFCGVLVAQSLFVFVFFCFFFVCVVFCLFVPFLFVIVLSVHLRFMDYDDPFVTFKRFLFLLQSISISVNLNTEK